MNCCTISIFLSSHISFFHFFLLLLSSYIYTHIQLYLGNIRINVFLVWQQQQQQKSRENTRLVIIHKTFLCALWSSPLLPNKKNKIFCVVSFQLFTNNKINIYFFCVFIDFTFVRDREQKKIFIIFSMMIFDVGEDKKEHREHYSLFYSIQLTSS